MFNINSQLNMDMKHLKTIIDQVTKKIKKDRLPIFLSTLQNPPKLVRVQQQLTVQPNHYDFKLVADQLIKKNQQVFLVSTEKCFTSAEFLGATPVRAQDLTNATTEIAHKYYSNNIQQYYLTTGLLKLLRSNSPSVCLCRLFNITEHQISFILAARDAQMQISLIIHLQEIYSSNVSNLVRGTSKQCLNFIADLKQHRIYGINEHIFFKIFQSVRRNLICFTPSDPKYFDLNSVQILSPLVNNLEHSFQPNCKVDGCYMVDIDQSYVEVSSLKEIQPGEQTVQKTLTINYGNLQNLDFLMRYGFLVPDNPYNQLALDLSFDNYLSSVSEVFELKQKLLRMSSIKDIENQVIYPNRLNVDLLKYLRIYFLTESDIKNNLLLASQQYDDFDKVLELNNENEEKVCNFMLENLRRLQKTSSMNKMTVISSEQLKNNSLSAKAVSLDSLEDLKQLKAGEFRDLMQVQLEEEQILLSNIKYFELHRKQIK